MGNSESSDLKAQLDRMEKKVDSSDKQLDGMEKKLDKLDGNSESSDLKAQLDRIEKKVDSSDKQLDGMEKKLDKLDGMEKKLNRIDNRSAALVEWGYRSVHDDYVSTRVVTAEDAVRLLFPAECSATEITRNTKVLVDHLYCKETRALLKLICPEARISSSVEWEKPAHAALKVWLHGNRELEQGDDYSKKAKWAVAKKFKELLDPFCSPGTKNQNGAKRTLHERAKDTLLEDKCGLTLSLIFAHESLQRDAEEKSKCWAWRVLDFDGFGINTQLEPTVVTEIKSGQDVSTAKKQLKLRARFLGAVASSIDFPKIKRVYLVAAILKSNDEENRVNQADPEDIVEPDGYDKIAEVILRTEYFRLCHTHTVATFHEDAATSDSTHP